MSPGAPAAALISGHEDAYDGFICDEQSVPAAPGEFGVALDASLAVWQQVIAVAGPPPCWAIHQPLPPLPTAWPQKGYRGIWLKMPAAKAHVIGHAVDRGFEFHHAEKV